MRKRNRSVACGAWTHRETGAHAHEYCTGKVNLPAPDNVCSCWCHGREDADPFDGTDAEHALLMETHAQYVTEQSALTFAEWLTA